MKLTARAPDMTAFSRETAFLAQSASRGLWRAVRAVSLSAERRIKSEMPVDTGRARASWGHWTPGDLSMGAEANAGDATWTERESDLSIEQGSNVEYVVYLNDGHSAQAPAGFIDMAAEQAQQELDKEVDRILNTWGFN